MSDFSNTLDQILDAILGFLKDAYEWVLPIFKASLKLLIKGGGATLIDMASNAVKAAEQPGLTGDQKYDMAFEAVKQTFENEGREVVKSAINLAIEMAVAKMKAE